MLDARYDLLARETEQLRLRIAQLEAQLIEARSAAVPAGLTAAEMRLQALQEATAHLLTATTPKEVAEVVLHDGMRAVGAKHGALFLNKDNRIELAVAHGYPADTLQTYQHIPLDADMPIAVAARRGETLYFPTLESRAQRFPHLAAVFASQNHQAAAYVPLSGAQAVLGALNLGFEHAHDFGPHEQAFVQSLADLAAQALERIGLFEAERRARVEQAGLAARLQTFLDAAPMGVAFLDARLRYQHINRVLAGLNHLPPEAHIGFTARQLWPNAAPFFDAPLQQLLETGAPVLDHEYAGAGDYEGRFWRISFYPVRSAAGDIIGVGILTLETTESKRAEAEMGSQARLLDLSSDAILMRDASNRIVYWNHGAEVMYGYSREEVLGKETFSLLKQRFPQSLDATMATLWRDGHWEGELGQTRRDGSQITVLTRWALDRAPAQDDRPAAILVINTDITARKQAEQALREYQEMLALAMHGGRIGVWWQELENDVVWWSRELEEIVGLAPGSFAGNSAAFRAFVHPEDQDVITQAVERAIADHIDYAVEFRFRHVDGSICWMDGRGRATYDAAGRPLRLYGIGIDITERKQAEMDARFLADLAQIFTGATDAQELMWQVSCAIAAHLSANRAGFATLDEARQQATIHRDYSAGLSSIAGAYQMWWLGSSLMRDLHAGKLLIIDDVQADPRTAHIYTQALGPGGMRSVVLVPLLRMGCCVAGLFVTQDVPHVWTEREIDLLRTVAGRTWVAVESARLQAETQALNATLEARVAERTEALHQSREQLRLLSAHVARAREEERARIAREVHDELGGALTVLTMSLSQVMKRTAPDAGVTPRLEDMRAQIDALVQSVRRISYDLRPSMLDDFGLQAAMEWQAHEWQRRTGIVCRLAFDPDLQVDLSDRSRTAVFRVFQESLTNIARHSQASEVVVSAELTAGQLVLTVKDNGKGISAEALHSAKSLGLVGMRERIREVNGDVEIASVAGEGVTVTLRVPLDARHPERSEEPLPSSTQA